MSESDTIQLALPADEPDVSLFVFYINNDVILIKD